MAQGREEIEPPDRRLPSREHQLYVQRFQLHRDIPSLLLQVGVDRIVFSADYPYGSMLQARNFLESLPVSRTDKEKIAHGNAERLLRL